MKRDSKNAWKSREKKARSSRKETTYIGVDATVYDEIDTSITSEFVGYDRLVHESKITVLTTEREIVEALSDGDMGTVIVEQTAFMQLWVDSVQTTDLSQQRMENSR